MRPAPTVMNTSQGLVTFRPETLDERDPVQRRRDHFDAREIGEIAVQGLNGLVAPRRIEVSGNACFPGAPSDENRNRPPNRPSRAHALSRLPPLVSDYHWPDIGLK